VAVTGLGGGDAEHPWLRDVHQAPDTPLGEIVFSRMKQFTTMNKLKKKALLVRRPHFPAYSLGRKEREKGRKKKMQKKKKKKAANKITLKLSLPFLYSGW